MVRCGEGPPIDTVPMSSAKDETHDSLEMLAGQAGLISRLALDGEGKRLATVASPATPISSSRPCL